MNEIDSIFGPLYGKLCWNVTYGIGSFLTFEFGDPHFKVVREPFITQRRKLSRHATRRLVGIYGDWQLWIRLCDWRFYRNDAFIGSSESPKKELTQISLDLNGQALCNVKVNESWITVFEFDLGGQLETQPYEHEKETELDELWSLYQPSGMVFTLRSDGKFQNSMGNQPPLVEWLPIETEQEFTMTRE